MCSNPKCQPDPNGYYHRAVHPSCARAPDTSLCFLCDDRAIYLSPAEYHGIKGDGRPPGVTHCAGCLEMFGPQDRRQICSACNRKTHCKQTCVDKHYCTDVDLYIKSDQPAERKRKADDQGGPATKKTATKKLQPVKRKAGAKIVLGDKTFKYPTAAEEKKHRGKTDLIGCFAYPIEGEEGVHIFGVYENVRFLAFPMDPADYSLVKKSQEALARPGVYFSSGGDGGARPGGLLGTLQRDLGLQLPFSTDGLRNCVPGSAAIILQKQYRAKNRAERAQALRALPHESGFMNLAELSRRLLKLFHRNLAKTTERTGWVFAFAEDRTHAVALDYDNGHCWDPANVSNDVVYPIPIHELHLLGMGDCTLYKII